MKSNVFFFVFSLLFYLTGFCSILQQPSIADELYAGSAKVDITPTVSMKMSGYSQRQELSVGIHDPLYVRVLVLEVNGFKLAIITCDLIGYYDMGILDIAEERFNIPHVLVCNSHTHSGPRIEYDSPYAGSVEKAMVDGLEEALEHMFPARISAGYRSFPQLGYRRLVMREDGHARALFSDPERIPYGPVDPEVGVIKIEDKQGYPRIILMNYACHPVVNWRNYEFSADYPGVAVAKVEEEFGNNTMSMFVQGGGGNINPMFLSAWRNGPDDPIQTDYTEIEKMGSLLANEVIKIAKQITPPINQHAALKARIDSLLFTGRFDKGITFNVHFSTILIGNDIALATFPGEPFVDHQLFWKKHADVPHPFFFGYTFSSGGRSPGYVPDIRSAAYGGYGADSSERAIEIGAGEAIMNKHLENLYILRGIMRDKPGPN